jgi:hypothetical protein
MDLGLTALIVLGTFSTVHERVLEVIRRAFRGPPEYDDLQAIHDGFGHGFFRLPPGQHAKPAAVDAAPPSPGLIRRLARPYAWRRWRKLLDGITIGPWCVVFAVAIAFFTRADALALFHRARPGDPASEIAFFASYLAGWGEVDLFRPWTWTAEERRAIAGCWLMGLSTALGSRFWHDLSKGLIDIRDRVKESPKRELPKTELPKAPG